MRSNKKPPTRREFLHIVSEPGLKDALRLAAKREHMPLSVFVRRVLFREVQDLRTELPA